MSPNFKRSTKPTSGKSRRRTSSPAIQKKLSPTPTNQGIPSYGDHATAATDHGDRLSAFQHSPLDLAAKQFRVVEVRKARSSSGLLSLLISHRSLDDTVYIALSYTWGPAEPNHPVEINGQLFLIRQNLMDFLIHADVTDEILWIDALCIDQCNDAERNHQVRLMGNIYSSAKQVLVWLGHGDRDIAQVLRITASRHAATSRKPNGCHVGYEFEMAFESQYAAIERPARPFWKVYQDLCSLPYWGRVWIIQEFVLNRSVIMLYGNVRCCWPCHKAALGNLERACDFYETSGYGVSDLRIHRYHWYGNHRVSTTTRTRKFSTENIFQSSRLSVCGDFHDVVYGVLGLMKHGSLFPVDHSQSALELTVTISLFSQESGGLLHHGRKRPAQTSLAHSLERRLFQKESLHVAHPVRLGKLPPPKPLNWKYWFYCPGGFFSSKSTRSSQGSKHDAMDRMYSSFQQRLLTQCPQLQDGRMYICIFVSDDIIIPLAQAIVTRKIDGVSRIIARIVDRDTSLHEHAVLDVEEYGGSMGLPQGLPGAYMPESGNVVNINNSYTAAILAGLPERIDLRQKCVPPMIKKLLRWQKTNAKVESSPD